MWVQYSVTATNIIAFTLLADFLTKELDAVLQRQKLKVQNYNNVRTWIMSKYRERELDQKSIQEP